MRQHGLAMVRSKAGTCTGHHVARISAVYGYAPPDLPVADRSDRVANLVGMAGYQHPGIISATDPAFGPQQT